MKSDFINYICTVISIVGAVKSLMYYKKSKNITMYANNNMAYVETKKILSLLNEMLKFVNPLKKRGITYNKEVAKIGEELQKSINIMIEKLDTKTCKIVDSILNSQQINVNEYIDSFVSGRVLVNGEFVDDNNFKLCKEKFKEVQMKLKEREELLSEKLK